MRTVKCGKVLTNLLFLFAGVVIGLAIALITGGILERFDSGTLLRHPKKIGNIKIIPYGPRADPNNAPGGGFTITKDGEPFLDASMNSNGKFTDIGIFHGKGLYFTMAGSHRTARWIRSTYGHTIGRLNTGEVYGDLNFDGQFDVKHIYNDKGELISEYIYINQMWLKAQINTGQAVVGQMKYIFDPNTGWQESK